MKNKMKFLLVVIVLLIVQSTQAQFLKKIKQRVKSTVEETVVRKSGEIAEQETSKKLIPFMKTFQNQRNLERKIKIARIKMK